MDEKTLELIVVSVFTVLILAAILINTIPFIIWTKKSKNASKSPLSDENKELLSKKIKAINASGGENDLADYAWRILIKRDFSTLSENTETLIERFKSDVFVARNFRDDCQRIMDAGSIVDVEYIFSLEDEFFDKYRRIKVLRLVECDSHKAVRVALDDVHRATLGMIEYLRGFHRNERVSSPETWQDRTKYNLSKEKLAI